MSYKPLVCTIEPLFESSFQGYLTCPPFVAPGTWHLAPGTRYQVPGTMCQVQQKVGMWGIPEKNYQKLAQQCKLDHSNVLPAHEMTRSPFAGFSPIVIPIENFNLNVEG